MGKLIACGEKTPITPMVPALRAAWVAHCADCEGAPPGCQLSPWGFVWGTTSSVSCSNCSEGSVLSASTPTASITRSTPMPPVSSWIVPTGSSSSLGVRPHQGLGGRMVSPTVLGAAYVVGAHPHPAGFLQVPAVGGLAALR